MCSDKRKGIPFVRAVLIGEEGKPWGDIKITTEFL